MSLRSKLKELNISQNDFAEKCGISPQYLSDILSNRRNCPDIVYKELGIKRLSPEFIAAMNGVLNGEKWKRISWLDGWYIELCGYDDDVYIFGGGGLSEYTEKKKDMTATDWVQVKETK